MSDPYATSRLPTGEVLICRLKDGPCGAVAAGCSLTRCLLDERRGPTMEELKTGESRSGWKP